MVELEGVGMTEYGGDVGVEHGAVAFAGESACLEVDECLNETGYRGLTQRVAHGDVEGALGQGVEYGLEHVLVGEYYGVGVERRLYVLLEPLVGETALCGVGGGSDYLYLDPS